MTPQETAIVVGATGAMGQVIARRLASRGLKVIAVARSADSVAALAASDPNIVACVADIASDSAIDAIAAMLDGPVRMLVHGPGVATAGGVATAPTAAVVDAVNIKCGGLMRLCVRISNCSRLFLSMCGERLTVNFSILVGSGIGPRTCAPVRLAVATISRVDVSRMRWSNALRRILMFWPFIFVSLVRHPARIAGTHVSSR